MALTISNTPIAEIKPLPKKPVFLLAKPYFIIKRIDCTKVITGTAAKIKVVLGK